MEQPEEKNLNKTTLSHSTQARHRCELARASTITGTRGENERGAFEVAAATARLLKHYTRSGAWVEITPGSPSQAPRAGRDRDRGSRSSPNCPSDMSEPSDN